MMINHQSEGYPVFWQNHIMTWCNKCVVSPRSRMVCPTSINHQLGDLGYISSLRGNTYLMKETYIHSYTSAWARRDSRLGSAFRRYSYCTAPTKRCRIQSNPAENQWKNDDDKFVFFLYLCVWDIPFIPRFSIHTSSTAQGGGGSFKNRKPIGGVGCDESGMAERSHWWIERWLISLTLSLSFSDYLSVYLFICLSVCLSVYLSTCLSVYLSIHLSICLPVYLWCSVIQCTVV